MDTDVHGGPRPGRRGATFFGQLAMSRLCLASKHGATRTGRGASASSGTSAMASARAHDPVTAEHRGAQLGACGAEAPSKTTDSSAMCPRVTGVYTRRAGTRKEKDDERALEARPRPRRTEDDAAARRADPRRSHFRTGDALLPDLLAIPDPDRLGGDPRRHDVPASPASRGPAGREAGMGVHADHSGWCGALRGADGPAGGFAGRRGAGIRARRPGQHPAGSASAPGCGRMADRRPGDPCVLVEGTLRPSGTRAEHAAEGR